MKSWISEHTRLMISRQGYADVGACLILVGHPWDYCGYVLPIQQAG